MASSNQPSGRIASNWTREELLLWDERRRAAELSAAAPPSPHSMPGRPRDRRKISQVTGALRTDGESVERAWVNNGPVVTSTREMGPGSRPDQPVVTGTRPNAPWARWTRQERADVGEHLTRSGSANNAGAEAVDDIVREALAMSGSANNSSSASNSSSGDDSESDDEMPPLDPPEAGSPAVHYASLTCDDLYIRDARPPPLTTERKHQECGICLDVKSRPVSYLCGHSHCYVCIRLWLERDGRCPECQTVMSGPPFRHFPEEQGLAVDYPDWGNESQVKYTWSGLTFPVRVR